MNDPNSDIKGMKLYHHINRVMNELRELGKDETEALRVDELTGFDQLHYHGTEAVDEAIRAVGIDERSRVLEIGSGLGGPAHRGYRWPRNRSGPSVSGTRPSNVR